LTHQDAQAKLLAYVRDRIHGGELTERKLARLIGISQPHVHNVLKGVRNLSPEVFDSILRHFQISLLDLASAEELEASLQRRRAPARSAEVELLAVSLGPRAPWPAVLDRRRRFPLPFPSLLAPPNLVMARLAADPDMQTTLAGADIALLDTSEPRRRNLVAHGLYVISTGAGAFVRYIRPGSQSHYLVNDLSMDNPIEWQELPLSEEELFDAVKARVRWLGRERDRNLPMRQRGRFLYDAISM